MNTILQGGAAVARRIIAGIRPTRIELLKLRKREEIALRGRDLLEEKLNAMTLEFFRLLGGYLAHREAFDREIAGAYEVLTDAELVSGRSAIRETAYALPRIGDLSMEERSILGIRVPEISHIIQPSATGPEEYCPLGTPPRIVLAASGFSRILTLLLQLAEEEGVLRRLEHAITGTRRKVNALDLIVIPELRDTQWYIEQYLEELDREDLYRRKLTRAKQERGSS